MQISSLNFVAVCVVGSLVGAITGALIGLATESGFLRGSGIGAISGVVLAIEIVESSLDVWNSRDRGSWSLLYLVILQTLAEQLVSVSVREKVGPAVHGAVQSGFICKCLCLNRGASYHLQMNAISLPFMETLDLYETGSDTKGMSMDEVEKLPKSKVTARGNLDESGQRISCSVCLQVQFSSN